MNISNIIKYLTILVFILLLTSCKKSKETKLIGTWVNQPMENTTEESDIEQLWTFDASANIIVEETSLDTVNTYNGNYSMSSKNMGMSGYYIQITNVHGLLDGKYRIKQLDESKLSLHRIELANGNTAGAFLWREFLKK